MLLTPFPGLSPVMVRPHRTIFFPLNGCFHLLQRRLGNRPLRLNRPDVSLHIINEPLCLRQLNHQRIVGMQRISHMQSHGLLGGCRLVVETPTLFTQLIAQCNPLRGTNIRHDTFHVQIPARSNQRPLVAFAGTLNPQQNPLRNRFRGQTLCLHQCPPLHHRIATLFAIRAFADLGSDNKLC